MGNALLEKPTAMELRTIMITTSPATCVVTTWFRSSLEKLRPGSHGCKIWLFVREALQFPRILQQNLEAAARSEEKREAARRAASRASRAAAAEKKRRLQRLQCENEREVEVVKSRFFFFLFFFWKENFLGK